MFWYLLKIFNIKVQGKNMNLVQPQAVTLREESSIVALPKEKDKSFLARCARLIKKIFNQIMGFLLDALTLPLLVAATPIAFFNNDPKSLPAGTKKVTLCVHGFLHNKSAWILLKPFLDNCAEAGPVFSLNLGHPFQSIEDYTKYVQDKIAEIKCMAGNKDLEVNLVGHSMGGLVCANYAVKYATEDRVRIAKLITIGSPLQGTPMAYVAKLFCKCAAEMVPNSDFINTLNENIQDLKDVPRYHIGFGGDWIVPKSKSFFKGSRNHQKISYMGHVSALLSPKVRNFVLEAIQNDEQAVHVIKG